MLTFGPTRYFRGRNAFLWCLIIGLAGFALGLGAAPLSSGDDVDENHHELTVVVGNTPFQFSPAESPIDSTLILATVQYPSDTKGGLTVWELAIYGPGNGLVRTYTGTSYLPPDGTLFITQAWDGRDLSGRLLPDGEYQYELTVRYAPEASANMNWVSYEMFPLLFSEYETDGARGTTRIQSGVDTIAAEQASRNGNLIRPQADPLDPQFPYNFYYGNFHSQSNFSDGGWPVTGSAGCNVSQSGHYCEGTFTPTDAFNYARYTGGLDFLAVTDHNHLFDCSSYYRADVPYTCRLDPATVRGKYQSGLSLAQAATEDGAFVAVYGEEFGVTTLPTDGHVGVLESPVLFNWEEHQSGSCYDVFVGRSKYTDLYTAMVNNPSPWGPMGILNHPAGAREFNYFELNEAGKDAVVGIEVVNGPAFSDSEAFSCGGTHYDGDNVFCLESCRPDCTLACNLSQHHFMSALNKGFRVAPFASQDNHRNNFGTSTGNRTVVLANALTKDELMNAVRARHVFATSRDSNAQLAFMTADGARIMGDSFRATSPVNFHASVRHPDGRDLVQELRVYIGYPGLGRVPSLARTSNRSTYDFSLTFRSGDYAYVFIYVKQTDGSELWSAPMWITVN